MNWQSCAGRRSWRRTESALRLLTAVGLLSALLLGCGEDQQSPAARNQSKTQSRAPSLVVDFDSQPYQVTAEDRRKVAGLIDRFQEIEDPDYGFAPWMSGRQFAPVADSGEFNTGILMNHGLKTSEVVTQVVALGPKSLPDLLERLTDETPTKLVMKHEGFLGIQWYASEIPLNDAHPAERRAREQFSDVFEGTNSGAQPEKHVASHTVTVGDVCFAILGQIVNRSYQAARYQPTACRVINSPTHDPKIAEVVRAIWTSDDPAKMLFDSLMIDLNNRSDDRLQAGAVMRLLYYFPDETAERIAERIKSFDLSDPAWSEGQDGFDPESFIEAAASSRHEKIVDALLHVARHAESAEILHAAITDAVVRRNADHVLRRMQEVLASTESSSYGAYDARYDILKAAVKYFPSRSQPMFDGFHGRNASETLQAKLGALTEPREPQPWMREFLKSLLDDKTETGDGYGPEWNEQPVRVCDQAAKILADGYLPKFVRFEYEQNPAYLDGQIAKIRRVLAGEKDVSFEPPPEWLLPQDLPTREAKRVVEVPIELGVLYTFSTENKLWFGHGFAGRGGWARDTVEFDVAQGKIVARTPLDQWQGGVSLLHNGPADRAYCYHGDEGGHVLVRDLRTAKVLHDIETPFHDGLAADDPLQVRNLGDITVCGPNGRWIVALTEDYTLHSIDTKTGLHRIEKKDESEEPGTPAGGRLVGLQFSSKLLIEDNWDVPLQIWDQATRTMKVANKVPQDNWQGGWGNLAWNSAHGEPTLWNIDTLRQIPLPRDDSPIRAMACDSDQTTLFVHRDSGAVDVFRILDGREVQPLRRLAAPPGFAPQTSGPRVTGLFVSADDRYVFCEDWPPNDRNGEQTRESNRTRVAIFDVADLTP